MDHGGLDFGSSRVALYSELVRGIRDLSSTTPSHLRALHRISRFGLLARWTLPVSGLAWGHNRTNQGRRLEKSRSPFSPWRTRRTRDVGIRDDRCTCLRALPCGVCTARAALPRWRLLQHTATTASVAWPRADRLETSACHRACWRRRRRHKETLKWALGAHSGHCTGGMDRLPGMLDGEQRAIAAVCHIVCGQHLTPARLEWLSRPSTWHAGAHRTTVVRGV